MEKTKYRAMPLVPAVESSPRPLYVDPPPPPPQKEPSSPAPIELDDDDDDDGNQAIKLDKNGLQVMQDEGGKGGPARAIAEPAPPPAGPERK
jgi:hypothetical protein